jgi:hypothetical protein
MFTHRYTGSVVVNGSPRQVDIEGNPLGRTLIQVDGSTVYDKKPFIQKEIIDFNVLPGKPAKMHWHQVSALKMEVDIIVDSKTTTLSALAKDGSVRGPVGEKARQSFNIRMTGLGFLGGAALSFWLNYSELTSKGEYYPKWLAIIPLFALMGVVGLVRPDLDFSPKNKVAVWVTAGFSLAAVVFGFTFFTDWFLGTFGTH